MADSKSCWMAIEVLKLHGEGVRVPEAQCIAEAQRESKELRRVGLLQAEGVPEGKVERLRDIALPVRGTEVAAVVRLSVPEAQKLMAAWRRGSGYRCRWRTAWSSNGSSGGSNLPATMTVDV